MAILTARCEKCGRMHEYDDKREYGWDIDQWCSENCYNAAFEDQETDNPMEWLMGGSDEK